MSFHVGTSSLDTSVASNHRPRICTDTPLLKAKAPVFRLLKLLKYESPEIECELVSQSLEKDMHFPYEALSYVWGSSELVECITLNRQQLWVTDNLFAALQCLRHRDRDRYLWIDAICINQADKEEQGHQVQRMGTIYKSANKVLFWLGKATRDIINLMDALNKLQRLSTNCGSEQWTLEDKRWRYLWAKALSKHSQGEVSIKSHRTGLQRMLGRDWFTRIWILQEAARAREADICCGTRSISAHLFALAPLLLEEVPPPHCQAVMDIMPGPSRLSSWWAQKHDLYILLKRFQAGKATDERDKVFALLGMSSQPLDLQSVSIDYRKPAYQVIEGAIKHLLQSTPISVHEILDIMGSFETLDTTYFLPTFNQENPTEVLFPDQQSGKVLRITGDFNDASQGIATSNDPARLLIEERQKKSVKCEGTCYSQVMELLLKQHESTDSDFRGLTVISWGSNEKRVRILLVNNPRNALLQAASQEYNQIVKQMLRIHEVVEAEKLWHKSALQAAVENGLERTVKTLIKHYIDVSLFTELSDKALRLASTKGHEPIVRLLLDAGAHAQMDPKQLNHILFEIVKLGVSNEHTFRLLFDAGADVTAQDEEYGDALQLAAIGCKNHLVKLLLREGANVNAQGGRHGSALQAAANANSRIDNKQVVETLLDAGADVNTQGGFHGNALQAAARGEVEDVPVVQLLLDAGADVNAQGGYYGNALYAACRRENVHVATQLLKAGADVNKNDPEQGTALQGACSIGSLEIVVLLLTAGARVNDQGGYYGNALQAACSFGSDQIISLGALEIVQLLLTAGARVNDQGGYYGNALQAACSQGSFEIVQLLLTAGARVNAQGGYWVNALQAACVSGRLDLVRLMLDAGAYLGTPSEQFITGTQAQFIQNQANIGLLLRAAGADTTSPR